MERKTGTFPRLKVALNNQGAGGQQPGLLGFNWTSEAGATPEPEPLRAVLPAPVQGRVLVISASTPLESGEELQARPELRAGKRTRHTRPCPFISEPFKEK